jgi:hypothetical protein
MFNKTKFAPVCPARIYRDMEANGYLPLQVLLLAHDVVANPKEYETFKHSWWAHTNIIMDNSVVENGGAVSADMVEKAAEIVEADIVVLPDVLGNSVETILETTRAWHTWETRFRNYKKMVVIQGETVRDWLHCAETLKERTNPDWIAVPRVAEGIGDIHRYQLVTFAKCLWPNLPIHLLGFSDYIWYDLLAASHYAVASIDSAVPLRMKPDNLLGSYAGKRGNWWETVQFEKFMIESCRRIDDYIDEIAET